LLPPDAHGDFLFKKYLPLVKRVAEAGWRPVTQARCDNEKILVERFGPDAAGHSYFTLFNDTAGPQSGNLVVEGRPSAPDGSPPARELVSNTAIAPTAVGYPILLPPQAVAVIDCWH